MDKDVVINEATRLADIIINKYSGKNGLLYSLIDASTGRILSRKSFIDDLGDYVQNFAWLGKVTNNQKYIDWSINQVRLCDQLAFTKYNIFNHKITADQIKAKLNPTTSLYPSSSGDIITGLTCLYSITENQYILNIAKKLVEGIKKSLKRNQIPRFFFPKLCLYAPITSPDVTGNVIEELVNLYYFTKNEKYIEFSKTLLEPWIKDKYFLEHGLFPSKKLIYADNFFGKNAFNLFLKLAGIKMMNITSMIKHNTNMIYGMLNIYKANPDKRLKNLIETWLNSVEEKLLTDDGFYSMWNGSSRKGFYISLANNHAIIDAFLESYLLFKDKKYLRIVEDVTKKWLDRQSRIGLFPESPDNPDESRRVKLDPNTDFMVLLLKIYEATRNKKYMKSALSCLEGILKYHKTDNGLIWATDSETGKVICSTMHVKFLTLFLKALLTTCTVLSKKRILEPKIKILTRDR